MSIQMLARARSAPSEGTHVRTHKHWAMLVSGLQLLMGEGEGELRENRERGRERLEEREE